MSKSYKYSRRQFVGSLPCLALGTTTLFSSLVNLKSMNSLAASTSLGDEYKALVCILLNGGNDSFNMLVPRGQGEYQEYASTRTNQAIPQDQLIAIDPNTSDGKTYGLHPELTGVKRIFDQGRLAFVNNVGTLIEPTTKGGIENQTARLPLGLLSHSDQVMHWQTGLPQDRSSLGWGGRMADLLQSMNTNNGVSMNISLGGTNIFQRGNEVNEYAINNDGGVSVFGYNDANPFFNLMTEDINSMIDKQYEDLFRDSYKNTLKRSIESNEIFNEAIENAPMLTTQFSNNNLSLDLQMVANTLAARNTLGAKRQIFFVQLGGFDNHDELLNRHAGLMNILDTALSEFDSALGELGLRDCVTTFTISDFARTLTSNGNGTDHGWGGNAIVMGGAVKGKDMYGMYPDLALNSSLELGGGVLIPTTSADSYFAELALWFGISPNDLSLILPNIGNFYSVSSGDAPLGFLI